MDQTIQEKVQQAVSEAYEHLAELNVAEEELSRAKMAEDAAREASPVEAIKEEAKAREQTDKNKAVSHEAAGRTLVASEYAAAQVKRDQDLRSIDDDYKQSVEEAVNTYDATVNQALKDQEQAMLVPSATVHKARQNVQALRATISQHNRNIQKSFGINLDNLVNG